MQLAHKDLLSVTWDFSLPSWMFWMYSPDWDSCHYVVSLKGYFMRNNFFFWALEHELQSCHTSLGLHGSKSISFSILRSWHLQETLMSQPKHHSQTKVELTRLTQNPYYLHQTSASVAVSAVPQKWEVITLALTFCFPVEIRLSAAVVLT